MTIDLNCDMGEREDIDELRHRPLSSLQGIDDLDPLGARKNFADLGLEFVNGLFFFHTMFSLLFFSLKVKWRPRSAVGPLQSRHPYSPIRGTKTQGVWYSSTKARAWQRVGKGDWPGISSLAVRSAPW